MDPLWAKDVRRFGMQLPCVFFGQYEKKGTEGLLILKSSQIMLWKKKIQWSVPMGEVVHRYYYAFNRFCWLVGLSLKEGSCFLCPFFLDVPFGACCIDPMYFGALFFLVPIYKILSLPIKKKIILDKSECEKSP